MAVTAAERKLLLDGQWVVAANQRMDAVLVVEGGTVSCKKLRSIRKGDLIVCGMQGIRVAPDVQQRDKPTFGFMSNEVSSERRVETAVSRVAELMRQTRAGGGRIAFVVGPVVIHTGGTEYFCRLIERGYVALALGFDWSLFARGIAVSFEGIKR